MTAVKIEDYIDYLNHLIQTTEVEIVKNKAVYDTYKKEYEQKFFPKLFGWKFEDSWLYDGFWYFRYAKRFLTEYQTELAKLEYIMKSFPNQTETECTRKEFFIWAKNNNIPY